ncbi:MAG: formiminotetrahydrofolate cyclodeaminase [Firmicutes bacterium]|nr:formiminotetrahydrofolate cyclodeaminase [Bacillota bacterium]
MATKHETLDNFCSQLAAGTPAPGGGAAAAVAGAMGAALVSMVAGLTLGREKYAGVQAEMAELQVTGRSEVEALFTCADEDQTAFNAVMAAFALPKGTDEEKAQRQQAVQAGYRQATEAPLKTMAHGLLVMRVALAAANRGNTNALSDAYVAYLTAAASFEGALWNVAINLGSLKDEGYRQRVVETVARLRAERDEVAAAMQALTPDPVARFLART